MRKIFIVHGWTYTLEAWEECARELRNRSLDPVLLKVPGLTEASDKPWTLAQYALWLEGKLAGEQDITLVGHSNGGRIALAYAAKHPSALRKLILIDAAGIPDNRFHLRAKRTLFGAISKIGRPFARIPILSKIYYRGIGAKDYGRATETMRATMKDLLSHDLTSELPKISIPTLIIWGAQDTATPLSGGKLMHEKIAGSKLIVMPEAGHSPHKTHPREVADAIAKF